MSNLDKLRELIQTQYSEDEPLLGSQLGAIVKKEYAELMVPGMNLASLINKHLSDLLKYSGKQGRDNIYRVINSSGDSLATPYSSDDGELWNVFSNPRYPGSIFIRNADRTLVKFNSSISSTAHGFTELPRLTDEDIRQIITDFINNTEHFQHGEQKKELIAELNAHYWRNWMQYLRSVASSNNAVIVNWRSHHAQAIENAFASRLDHFGFSPKDIEKWVWVLLSSRTKLPPGREPKVSADLSSSIGGSELTLRQLIHKAIDSLSDDQLRSVTLPVGALYDVTRNS